MSRLKPSNLSFQISDVTPCTSNLTLHTSHFTSHAMSQTLHLKRKTGKLTRTQWHGDDVTDCGLLLGKLV